MEKLSAEKIPSSLELRAALKKRDVHRASMRGTTTFHLRSREGRGEEEPFLHVIRKKEGSPTRVVLIREKKHRRKRGEEHLGQYRGRFLKGLSHGGEGRRPLGIHLRGFEREGRAFSP